MKSRLLRPHRVTLLDMDAPFIAELMMLLTGRILHLVLHGNVIKYARPRAPP